jgi:hypothetical protein
MRRNSSLGGARNVGLTRTGRSGNASTLGDDLLTLVKGRTEMIIGYARVSTDGQTLDVQQAALLAAGAEKVFAEKIGGAVTERKALARAIAALGPGDTLLVTRLDRLASSTRNLLNVLDTVGKAGAGFRSLARGELVSLKDALHRSQAHACRLPQHSAGPMCCFFRRGALGDPLNGAQGSPVHTLPGEPDLAASFYDDRESCSFECAAREAERSAEQRPHPDASDRRSSLANGA